MNVMLLVDLLLNVFIISSDFLLFTCTVYLGLTFLITLHDFLSFNYTAYTYLWLIPLLLFYIPIILPLSLSSYTIFLLTSSSKTSNVFISSFPPNNSYFFSPIPISNPSSFPFDSTLASIRLSLFSISLNFYIYLEYFFLDVQRPINN